MWNCIWNRLMKCLQLKQAGNCVYMLKAVDRKTVATGSLILRSFVFGVLFNDAINSWLCIATMIDERMTEGHWWHDIKSETPCTWRKPSTTITSSIVYPRVSQPPGRGPVPGPGINYTGPREILLELIVNLHVIFYLSTCHTIHIIVLILFMIIP